MTIREQLALLSYCMSKKIIIDDGHERSRNMRVRELIRLPLGKHVKKCELRILVSATLYYNIPLYLSTEKDPAAVPDLFLLVLIGVQHLMKSPPQRHEV